MADRGSLRLTVEAPACFVGEFRFTVLRRQYGQGSLFAVVEAGAGVRLHDANGRGGAGGGKGCRSRIGRMTPVAGRLH